MYVCIYACQCVDGRVCMLVCIIVRTLTNFSSNFGLQEIPPEVQARLKRYFKD